MSVACHISVCRVWSSFNILPMLVFEGKVPMVSLDRFSLISFWNLVNEADNMAMIQPANSALALAIRLELLFFR